MFSAKENMVQIKFSRDMLKKKVALLISYFFLIPSIHINKDTLKCFPSMKINKQKDINTGVHL